MRGWLRAALGVGVLALSACGPPRKRPGAAVATAGSGDTGGAKGAGSTRPRSARPLERFVPRGADLVIALDLARLRAAWGEVDLGQARTAGALAGVELQRLRAAQEMDEAVLAVWDAGAAARRELVIARGGKAGTQIYLEGDAALMTQVEALVQAPGIGPEDPRLAVSELGSDAEAAIRVRLAGTAAVREALLPLLGEAAIDVDAVLVEVRVRPEGEGGDAFAARAVVRTASVEGAEFLATHIAAARARLLASAALGRLGLDRFVAPLTAATDGVRVRVAFALGHAALADLGSKLRRYGEVLEELRARTETGAAP